MLYSPNYYMISFIIFLLLLLASPSPTLSSNPSFYYNQCAPSTCGSSTLQFPFGLNPPCRSSHITTSCVNNSAHFTEDDPPYTKYKILEDLTQTIYIRRSFMVVDISLLGCGELPVFMKKDWSKWLLAGNFRVSTDYKTGTFFNCTQAPEADMLLMLNKAPCLECGNTSNLCYFYDGYFDHIPNCRPTRVALPQGLVNNLTNAGNLRGILQEGFSVEWDSLCGESCTNVTGGRCGFVEEERSKNSEVCLCSTAVHKNNCSDGMIIKLGAGQNMRTKGFMFAGIALGSAFVLACLCFAYIRRGAQMKKKVALRGQDEQALRRYLGNRKPHASVETFLENYTNGMPTRFSFKQIKKYSSNFRDKLGQGGFGSVFKATLPNGIEVAVKILDENEQSESQFLNEVLTVGKIHHNHLVRLLGFCFQQSRRVLIYEFMGNGSLEKYIHRENQDSTWKLSWTQLHEIAVGTARGIAYLHEECRQRILHCDIKPHNILLNDKFQPKVSDFGLAQMVNREKSHITLTCGRGTPGYAPPEVWWKNYGPITEKSDVYSYGMVLLEMVGGRRNFNGNMSQSSEMYFPEWAFRHHVVNQTDVVGGSKWHKCEGEAEEETAKRMELVGLWCIQFSPPRRPSMREVIEMLEGNVVIEMPPVPFDATTSQFGNRRMQAT